MTCSFLRLIAVVLSCAAAGGPLAAEDSPAAAPATSPATVPRLLPAALVEGDLVAVIAPASPARAEEISEAAANLRRMGLRVKVSPHAVDRDGYLAGSDETRAAELNRAFADPEVRMVLCARGGYGSPRILDRLDYDIIRKNPKVLAGYSDITALLIAVRQRTGLVTFHGPMGKDFSGRAGLSPFAEEHFRGLLGPQPFPLGSPELMDWGGGKLRGAEPRRTIAPGTAEGILTGGNLSTIAALMGTPHEIDVRDAILFLEDVNEEPFRIDRMLCQLKLAGKLAKTRGILLGGFTRCVARTPSESWSLDEVLDDSFAKLGVPVLAGFPAGHLPEQPPLPFGVRVRLDATARTLAILEPAVSIPAARAPSPVAPPSGAPGGSTTPRADSDR